MHTRIISKIIEKDRVFGKLCSEAQNSYEQENYFSALACLFVAMEQAVKFMVESHFINFEEEVLKEEERHWPLWKYIKLAKKNDWITKEEEQFIKLFVKYRNDIFHSNLYPTGIEIRDVFYSYSEDETLKIIYEEFSHKIFSLISGLVK